jgi:hypothetical protein
MRGCRKSGRREGKGGEMRAQYFQFFQCFVHLVVIGESNDRPVSVDQSHGQIHHSRDGTILHASPRCVTYIPWHEYSKLLLYVSTASTHCVISRKTAIFIHQHYGENPKPHYCILLSSFLCLHCFFLWEETASISYFNIRGECLMCLNNLMSSSGRTVIQSSISNQLPVVEEHDSNNQIICTFGWYTFRGTFCHRSSVFDTHHAHSCPV